MAERRRRGEDPDENQDDALLDDAIDDDDVDSRDDEDGDDAEDRPAGRSSGRSGGTATKARPRAEGAKPPTKRDTERVGIFGRLVRFIREIVSELRKVIWPTRKELLTYTTVVVVFVAVMLTIVGLLDLGFAKAVLWVFGDPSKE